MHKAPVLNDYVGNPIPKGHPLHEAYETIWRAKRSPGIGTLRRISMAAADNAYSAFNVALNALGHLYASEVVPDRRHPGLELLTAPDRLAACIARLSDAEEALTTARDESLASWQCHQRERSTESLDMARYALFQALALLDFNQEGAQR